MMRMLSTAAAFCALSLAAPALAENFAPPEGCAAFLTVQSKDCSVSLLWRCEAVPAGDFWEATFGPEGLESVTGYNKGYQWLESAYAWDGSRETLLPPATDPINLDTLLADGVDTYDFAMRRAETSGSHEIHVVGADQLTGSTVIVDGHRLEAVSTELQVLGPDGAPEYQSRGTQYLSRELRVFFYGAETVTEADGASKEFDGTPVDIIAPGEPGFGNTAPLYSCEGNAT